MPRRLLAFRLAPLLPTLAPLGSSPAEPARPAEAQWVWYDEGDPAQDAPAETRYFRRAFTVDRPGPKPADKATLDITADNRFTVWVNGAEVGSGDTWQRV